VNHGKGAWRNLRLNIDAQKVLDAIPDGIHIVDRNGCVVAANKAWVRHMGMPMKHMAGRHITDVMKEYYFTEQCLRQPPPKWKMREKEYEQAVCLRVLEEGDVVSDYFQQGCILSTGIPLYDDDGRLEYVLTVTKDLTQIVEVDGSMESRPDEFETDSDTGLMLGNSPAMERIRVLISEVAATDATILIIGDTGVGKEVVAGEIQRRSLRADKPFVKVNCAAIPENLMEAEFFGYEKGAFTGASRDGKPGLLETANHGTVLLDEIGEFPLTLQPKLLRAIQERTITRVGGTTPIPIDVRIIAATNQDLQELVAKKKFREDLFYRLNVIPIYLPPLCERGSDIILLAKNFLHEFNKKYHRNKVFSPGALDVLMEYSWPGNVRELKNLVERLVVLGSQNEISADRVQRFLSRNSVQDIQEDKALTLKEAVDQVQRNMISAALLRYGSTYKAAEALQISQTTLVRKARQLGIKTSR